MPDSSQSGADGGPTCAACGTEIPATARFCPQCGVRVGAECAACGARLSEDARFCGHCGGPREAESEGPAGPRQLTVMFCDLVGYTDLARQLDGEELGHVVGAYQEAATDLVTRFEGHVAQYLGDGVLVYFGFPRAHEDDALRAARAARAIVEEMPEVLARAVGERFVAPAIRIGVHTGPVVVDRVGAGARRELLAMGDTVNLAARLESFAPPGEAVLSDATRALLRDAFELEALGSHSFKGFPEQVPVWRLGRLRAALPGGRARVAAVREMVGRIEEQDLLLEAIARAQAGEGQVALVRAEPGLGKSRLVGALAESVAERPIRWFECGCSPFDANTPFHPFLNLLRGELGIGDAPVAESDLGALVRGLGAGVDPLGAALIATLLGATPESIRRQGLPDLRVPSAEARRERGLEALARWLTERSRFEAAVIVVEDLHWADPSTLELLGRLIGAAAGHRLMLLLTARPEFESPWPLPEAIRLELAPLDADQVKQLVARVAPDGLEGERLASVVRQSDGVPLFAEELARSAAESADPTVPTSLTDSLMARLDRLGPARRAAQLAAVLGREFDRGLLEAVWPDDPGALPELLGRLIDADLFVRNPGSGPDAERFTFRHALFREVAYASLLRRERQEHHGRIARVLEERFPDSAQAQPAQLARHFEGAGQLSQAVSQLHRAGRMAAERSALLESIAHLERARALLGQLDASPERDARELEIQMELGAPLQAVRGYADPEVVRTYERALALCDASPSSEHRGDVLWGLFTFNLVRGSLATASELSASLESLAERTADPGLRVAAHDAVGSALYFRGEFPAALQEFERAVSLSDPERDHGLAYVHGQDHAVSAGVTSGMAHWLLGRPLSALAASERAVGRARELGHPMSLAFALGYAGAVAALRREPARVRALCDELTALADEQHLPVWGGFGRLLRGWALCGTPDDEQGLEDAVRGLRESAATGAGFEAPFCSALMADAHLRAGRVDWATRSVAVGMQLARRNGSPYWDAELERVHGECRLADAGADADATRSEAAKAFDRAIAIARSQGARGPELRARVSAARLELGQGRVDQARALLGDSDGGWLEVEPVNPDLADAAALRAELGA